MAGRKLDDYKPREFYKTHSKERAEGFSKFEVDGEYYFCRYFDHKLVLISQSYSSAAGRDNGVKSVQANEKKTEHYKFEEREGGKHGFSLIAGNRQEIGVSPSFAKLATAQHLCDGMRGRVKKKAAAAQAPVRKKSTEDDYQPLAFYERQTQGRKEGIESFKGDDGQYYFACFENNKIAMISEGYPTEAACKTGEASVAKNMKDESRYVYIGPMRDGQYGFRLRAGNHKEIARSIGYGSAAAAAMGAAYLIGTRRRVAATPKPANAAIPKSPKAVTPVPPVMAAPIASKAATPRPAPSVSDGGGIWGWLKWLLLALLALLILFFLLRMCAAPKPVAAPPVVVAPSVVLCWDKSEAETLEVCPTKITCWDDSFATSLATCPTPPVAKDHACWDGTLVADALDCSPRPAPKLVPVPIPTPKVSAMTGAATLFAATGTPKIIERLGSYPEFGDSRGLSGASFYDKLNGQYKTSDRDRHYLTYLSKQLGYTGWEEVTAADFTATRVADGTVGVLGFGDFHGLQHVKFAMSDLDHLAAFRFASRNGREVYFMQRCGNYFFPIR